MIGSSKADGFTAVGLNGHSVRRLWPLGILAHSQKYEIDTYQRKNWVTDRKRNPVRRIKLSDIAEKRPAHPKITECCRNEVF